MPSFLRPLLLCLAVVAVGVALALYAPEPAPTSEAPDAYAVSGAYEALVLWNDKRAYPNETIPSTGFAEAVAARRSLEAASRGGGEPWEAIGPQNIGGRSLAIVLNPERPETVWVGSAGGGLWRSYDAGLNSSWERISTGFGVTAASAIALAPDDTSTVYLGTGEVYRYRESFGGVVYRPTRGSYGMGILKSTDAGATWTKSLDWSRNQERGVQMIRIDPTDAATVWAATTEGILVSRDAGATWDTSLDVVMGTDISINAEDPDDILAACGNQESEGYGLYRTTDGGATWAQVTDGVPPSYIGKVLLSRHPTDQDTVYASVGNGIFTSGSETFLIRTVDGGDAWTTVSTNNYAAFQGWFAHYVGVNPNRPDELYLGGVPLFFSSNGGFNQVELNDPHPDHHAVAFHPTDPDIVYFAHDGGVARTTNGGSTIVDISQGYQTTQFYNGTSVDPGNADFAIGGLQDNNTVRYTGSPNWDRILGGDGSWSAIDPFDPNIVYASFQNLGMARSSDGGDDFDFIIPPDAGNTAFIAPYALAPTDPSRLYAGRSIVYRSENRGNSWTATNGGSNIDPNANPTLAMAVSPLDEDVVYVSTAPILRAPVDNPGPPRMFVTRNAGSSWTDITTGLPDRFVTDIAIDPSDDQVAWVTLGGFGTGHVYKTEDAGQTWTDVSGTLPDAPAEAVAFDPLRPGTVYIGNDVGVFETNDAGTTWNAFTAGLPEAVLVMDLVYSAADRTLQVATHGNGMYRRALPPAVASEPTVGPQDFRLLAVAPNPFRASTTLAYELDRSAEVRLEVFDAAGRRVALLDQGSKESGAHRVRFDAAELAAGVYVARLTAGGRTASRSLTLVR
ncbi:MAG: T9SS type A sorting domain-containing protein [Bacteroidota bacterium]